MEKLPWMFMKEKQALDNFMVRFLKNGGIQS